MNGWTTGGGHSLKTRVQQTDQQTNTYTKRQPNSEAPSKLSAVENTVNRMLYLILGAQLVITSVSLAAYLVWNRVRSGGV